MGENHCLLCDSVLDSCDYSYNSYGLHCPKCGTYILKDKSKNGLEKILGKVLYNNELYYNDNEHDKDFKKHLFELSCYVSEKSKIWQYNNRYEIIDEQFIRSLFTSNIIPRTPQEKIIKLLHYINKKTDYLGMYVEVKPSDVYMINQKELNAYCKELLMSKLIKIKQGNNVYSETTEHTENWHQSPTVGSNPIYLHLQENNDYLISITLEGIRYLGEKTEELRNDKCFVAMWFEENNNKDLYENMIQPACLRAGYKSERVDFPSDLKNFSGDIYNEIIKFIRTTFFTIVDLTGNRSSVTYEAGFAEGLGKKVIYTVNEETKENLPFDLSHKRILMWKKDNPDDFIKKLTNEIISIMGTGPLYRPE